MSTVEKPTTSEASQEDKEAYEEYTNLTMELWTLKCLANAGNLKGRRELYEKGWKLEERIWELQEKMSRRIEEKYPADYDFS